MRSLSFSLPLSVMSGDVKRGDKSQDTVKVGVRSSRFLCTLTPPSIRTCSTVFIYFIIHWLIPQPLPSPSLSHSRSLTHTQVDRLKSGDNVLHVRLGLSQEWIGRFSFQRLKEMSAVSERLLVGRSYRY